MTVASQRQGHFWDDLNHALPRFYRFVGEEKINHNARLGVGDVSELLFNGAHGVHALYASGGELVLHLH